MSKLVCAMIATGLILAVGGRCWADDKEEARATIDRAIKATGGEGKLVKLKAMTWKEKGTFYGMGDGVAYTGNYAIQLPNQFRMEIENVFIIVVDGDKGWTQMGGNTTEMTKDQLAEQKESMYASSVRHLTPLTDKAFTLTPLRMLRCHVRPASCDTAMPMFEAAPSTRRPSWYAATTVEPRSASRSGV